MRKLFSRRPYIYFLLFIVVALVMLIYEIIKEIIFDGALTPWQSHTITILVTSSLAVLSAVVIRSWSSSKLKKEHMIYLEKEKAITQEYFQAKEEAELLSNTFLNYAGALVVVLNDKGRIIQFNHASEKLSGLTFDEVKGKFPWDTFLPPEDAETIRKDAFEVLANNPQAMSGSYTNYWMIKHGGRALIEWVNNVILDDQQRMSYVVSVGTDITERKRLESRLKEGFEVYQAAINTSSMGFWVVDMQGRLKEINNAYLNQSGYSREELLNMSIPDIDAEQTPNEIECRIKMIVEKGFACFRTKHRRKDGSIWPVEIVTSFSNVHDGCFFVFMEDITERIDAEEKLANYSHHLEAQVKERTSELEVARQEAEYANHAKSEFLSSMSHELRTPLNAILGFSQLIEMNTKVDKTRESSQEIINAGNHLLSLINQVLDLSKIESGNIELSIEKCSLNKIINNILALIKPIAEKHSILIDNKVSTLSYINVDEIRFKQILLNILSNAIKYNSENGKVIIDSSSNDKNILCLSISDTGGGLTPEQLSNLFEPFERLGVENSNIEGTGLGLKISKELAELMGGTITVESTVGKGSSFLIQFPLS